MKKIKERGDGPLSCCGVSDPYQSTATAPIMPYATVDHGSWTRVIVARMWQNCGRIVINSFQRQILYR